jgi:hypothetical protein
MSTTSAIACSKDLKLAKAIKLVREPEAHLERLELLADREQHGLALAAGVRTHHESQHAARTGAELVAQAVPVRA